MENIKIGTSIETWCCGQKVQGTIIEIKKHEIIVSHTPVKWGNDIYSKTKISKSLSLQYPISKTTPICFANGKEINLD